MKKTRKKSRYQLVNPTHKDKTAPAELELLHTRALLCIRNFTHYAGGNDAKVSVEKLFRDYKNNKDQVKEKLLSTFDYIRKEHSSINGLEDRIKEAKRVINEVAKKVWH